MGFGMMLALLAGCATPGPPLPPSLNLPEVVTDLTATRVGGQMRLRWTTPTHTTDKLLIRGPVTAEICRETAAATAVAAPSGGRGQGKAATATCAAVLRKGVTSGASDAMDTLPPELAHGPGRLLAYRVQLKNAAGRTAGPSPAVFAAAGAAPDTVEELHGTATRDGVVLEWRRSTQPEADGGVTVELDRTMVEAPSPPKSSSGAPAAAPQRMDALPGAGKESVEAQLRGGAADAGGTIDRTAQIGHTYLYTAQRVRSVTLGGQTLALRSAPSAMVKVEVQDVFPPKAPTGLIAVPGIEHPSEPGSPGVAGGVAAPRPAIDLSWDPNMAPRIAGYRVYRRDAGDRGEWMRLDAELVQVTAYRDLTVAAGKTYTYRVTAVSDAGVESAASGEATETAAGQ